jgi:hypothetical protein
MNIPPHIFKELNEAKTLKNLKETIPDIIEELEFHIINELEPRIVSLEQKRNRTRRIRR